MQRLLTWLTVVSLLLWSLFPAPSLEAAIKWPLSKVFASTVKLWVLLEGEDEVPFCTAVSVSEDRSLFLTAHHCVDSGAQLQVQGMTAYPLKVLTSSNQEIRGLYPEFDLALINVPGLGLHRPALTLGAPPKQGDEVLVVGFTMAATEPVFVEGRIISPKADIWNRGLAGLVITTPFSHGMSGGPIVNTRGELISLVQWGDAIFGGGAPYTAIREILVALKRSPPASWRFEIPQRERQYTEGGLFVRPTPPGVPLLP